MLGADDPLPHHPHRILIAGVAGAGKTTLAARIAARTGMPHTEIDGLYHGANWTPRASSTDEVLAFTAEPRWVTEWQYRSARPTLAERADLMVWLDLPRSLTFRRVVRRTIHRARFDVELWNGNREPGMLHAVFAKEGIIRWSIATHGTYARAVPEAEAEYPSLAIVRLRTPGEIERWFAGPFQVAIAG